VQSELIAAFTASILTCWLLAEWQRREDRKLRSIESEGAAIKELQDAAARLTSAAGTAALLTATFLKKDLDAHMAILAEP
jgi:hypothetical protein